MVLEQLSSGTRPGEMVYLEEKMNSVKGVMFGERRSWSFTVWPVQLAVAARIGSTILYLKDANNRSVYHAVSQGMYNTWQIIDIEVQHDHADADLNRVHVAKGYLEWEKQFIEQARTRS